jgi:hypothetical protein
MEKLSFEFEIKGVTKSINSIAEAKDALSELQDVVENSDFGSEEFRAASTEIERVQAKLIEATSKGVEPATNGFKKLKDELKAAKNAQAEAAQTFGEGSKEYKAAAQQVANLQDKIDDLKDSSVSLKGTGIERLNSGVGLLKEGFANFDTDKLKVGFNALGSAMKAIPIFLIIEGVRYLVENFNELSEGTGIIAKALQGVSWIMNKLKEEIYAVTDALGLTNSALDKQGEAIKTYADKTKEALNQQSAAFDRQIAQAKAAGKSTVDLEIAKQKAIIETNKTIVKQIEAFVRAGGELDEEKRKLLSESLETIRNAKSQENVVVLTAQKEQNDAYKKKLEERKKLLEEAINEENQLNKNKKAFDLQLEVEKQAEQEVILTQSLEQQSLINDYFNQIDKERLAKWNEEQKQLLIDRTNQGLDTLTQFTNASAALSDAVFSVQLENSKKGSEEELKIKRKQFDLNKKIQIGAAVISGLQGALNAITAKSTIPQPFDAIYKGLQVATIAGTTAQTINKISSTPFEGGNASSISGNNSTPAIGGSAPAFNSIAPSVNPANQQPQSTRLDENGRPIGQNQSFRIKADVVENDMTEAQKEQEKRKSLITF